MISFHSVKSRKDKVVEHIIFGWKDQDSYGQMS